MTFFIIGISAPIMAGDFTISWQPNTEPDLAGYKVYYGSAHREYNPAIDVGNQTGYIFTAMPAGLYYVTVTAYDTSGNESEYSYELAVLVNIGMVSGIRKEP